MFKEFVGARWFTLIVMALGAPAASYADSESASGFLSPGSVTFELASSDATQTEITTFGVREVETTD